MECLEYYLSVEFSALFAVVGQLKGGNFGSGVLLQCAQTLVPRHFLLRRCQCRPSVLAPIIATRAPGPLTDDHTGQVRDIVFMAPALDDVQNLGHVVERMQSPEGMP